MVNGVGRLDWREDWQANRRGMILSAGKNRTDLEEKHEERLWSVCKDLKHNTTR